MTKKNKLLDKMRRRPTAVRFDELAALCDRLFGKPRQSGGSHLVYRMPWPGDPRVNIQRGHDGMAKAYQVRQVLAAVEKLEDVDDDL